MNWDYINEMEYEEIINELEMLDPSDFYFQLDYAAGCGTKDNYYFLITPAGFYDNNEDLLEIEECVPVRCLPEGFTELTYSQYEFNGDKTTGRQLLKAAGFVEKKMF